MLLLILLMVIVCSCIVWVGCSIQLGGVQIMIMAVIGLFTTAMVRAICKESVIDVYEEKRQQKVDDEFMLSFDIMDFIGGWAIIPVVAYAIASGTIIKRMVENFSLTNTGLIKPIIFLLLSEVSLFIGCFVCNKAKALQMVLYLEADVLHKTIWVLAGFLLLALVVELYIFLGIAMLALFLGNSLGGG